MKHSPLYQHKIIALVFVFFMAIVGSTFIFPESFARFLWKYAKTEQLSLWLSDDPALARKIGNYYFNVYGSGLHELEKAKVAYREALIRDENVERVHYQLGRIAFIEGDFFTALNEIEKEIEVNPTLGNSYYVRGLIYGYRGLPGDLERAETDFKRFISMVPTNWAGYNDLAWIEIQRGKFTAAKETVENAFLNLPSHRDTNVWLRTMYGIAELNLGNYISARDELLAVADIAEYITPEYFWSAYPGNNQVNAEEAFNQFKATLHFNLGIVYEKLGEWDLSIAEYQLYLALLPKGPYPKENDVQKKINELSRY